MQVFPEHHQELQLHSLLHVGPSCGSQHWEQVDNFLSTSFRKRENTEVWNSIYSKSTHFRKSSSTVLPGSDGSSKRGNFSWLFVWVLRRVYQNPDHFFPLPSRYHMWAYGILRVDLALPRISTQKRCLTIMGNVSPQRQWGPQTRDKDLHNC